MALLTRDIEELTLWELADFFGRGDNSMSQAASRLEDRMNSSGTIRYEVDSLKAELFLVAEQQSSIINCM